MIRQSEIDNIIRSMVNGQWKQAKELTRKGCKTKPERMAYRVGRIVGALCDPDGFRDEPDLARVYLTMFEDQ